jgi:hypothetical protein
VSAAREPLAITQTSIEQQLGWCAKGIRRRSVARFMLLPASAPRPGRTANKFPECAREVRLVGKTTSLCNVGQAKVCAPHEFKRTLDSTLNDKLPWRVAEELLECTMKVRLAQSNIGGQARDVGSFCKIFVD